MDELSFPSLDTVRQTDLGLNKSYGRFVSYYVFYGLIRGPPDRVSGKEISQKSSDQYIRTLKGFLDNLSLLIDSKNGGQTTPSIAIEDKDGQLNYWIAANCEVKDASIHRLEKILSSLDQMTGLSSLERKKVEDEICRQSIEFCQPKVKDYRHRLLVNINQIGDQDLSSAAETTMKERLEKLTPLPEDLVELCRHASVVARDTTMMKELKKLEDCPRTASWRRAASTVVKAAKKMPGLVYKPKVQRVHRPTAAPVLGDIIPLEALVSEFLPHLIQQDALKRLRALRKHDSKLIQDIYPSKLEKTRNLNVHAECIMADHFDCNQLRFYYDYRYVGCSKPSCYACDLYLKFHENKFEPRPCHDNVWDQWAPPSVRVGTRRDRLDSMQTILEKMINCIKEDIKKQIISPRVLEHRPADSYDYWTSTVSSIAVK